MLDLTHMYTLAVLKDRPTGRGRNWETRTPPLRRTTRRWVLGTLLALLLLL